MGRSVRDTPGETHRFLSQQYYVSHVEGRREGGREGRHALQNGREGGTQAPE